MVVSRNGKHGGFAERQTQNAHGRCRGRRRRPQKPPGQDAGGAPDPFEKGTASGRHALPEAVPEKDRPLGVGRTALRHTGPSARSATAAPAALRVLRPAVPPFRDTSKLAVPAKPQCLAGARYRN